MAGLIVGIIALIGVLTGCGFYFIPKYAMGISNGWITAVDTVACWIGANWIISIVIGILILLAILLIIGLCKKEK